MEPEPKKKSGLKLLKVWLEKIKDGEIKIILSAGIREKVKEYFEKNIKKLGFR